MLDSTGESAFIFEPIAAWLQMVINNGLDSLYIEVLVKKCSVLMKRPTVVFSLYSFASGNSHTQCAYTYGMCAGRCQVNVCTYIHNLYIYACMPTYNI